jgi:hypothetical protein
VESKKRWKVEAQARSFARLSLLSHSRRGTLSEYQKKLDEHEDLQGLDQIDLVFNP